MSLLTFAAVALVRAENAPPPGSGSPSSELPAVHPSNQGLPGGQAIDTLLSWAMYLGLTACVLGAIGAGAAIGLGHLSSRPHWAERGKVALVCSVIGAIIVGSAVTIVDTGFGMA